MHVHIVRLADIPHGTIHECTRGMCFLNTLVAHSTIVDDL